MRHPFWNLDGASQDSRQEAGGWGEGSQGGRDPSWGFGMSLGLPPWWEDGGEDPPRFPAPAWSSAASSGG